MVRVKLLHLRKIRGFLVENFDKLSSISSRLDSDRDAIEIASGSLL